MTARGNDQQVEKAKNLIIQSIIGLIIILSAYAITAFVGRKLTETNPTNNPNNNSEPEPGAQPNEFDYNDLEIPEDLG
jgi:flagellar basal body-associated protein FliL